MDMSLKERNLMQVAIDHFIEYQQDVFDLECNNHISLGYRAASEQDDYLYIIRDCASRLITAKHLKKRLTEPHPELEF
jgi:hypothetical protein